MTLAKDFCASIMFDRCLFSRQNVFFGQPKSTPEKKTFFTGVSIQNKTLLSIIQY